MPSLILRLPGKGGTVGGGGGFTATLQAEQASLVGPVKYLAGDTGHTVAPGYHGNGYVGDWGATGQTVTWSVTVPTAGTYRLTFRYKRANAGNATRELRVLRARALPGPPNATLSFPTTEAAWTEGTWGTVEALATIGDEDPYTIELRHPGPDGDNYLDIDELVVSSSTTPPPPTFGNDLTDPAKRSRADKFISSAENSTLTIQYAYIEDIGDGRGYTAGRSGFCSGTGDMLQVIDRYMVLKPSNNPLAKYRPALAAVNGTDSHAGLDPDFPTDWANTANTDQLFRQAQDDITNQLYFTPALDYAQQTGVKSALGQLIFYDTMTMHGDGWAKGFGAILAATTASRPVNGGDEKTFLYDFCAKRKSVMLTAPEWSDTSRIDTGLKKFLDDNKMGLELPLTWTVYGDVFTITTDDVTPPVVDPSDFRALFTSRHPAGSGRWYVDSATGNDANAGTSSGAPKKTIQSAINAASTGGIITVRNGTYYENLDLNGKNFSASSNLLIMADVGHNPIVSSKANIGQFGQDPIGQDRAILMRSCSYVYFYGLEVVGYDVSGYNADCISHRLTTHHWGVWKCYLHDGTHGLGVAGNQGGTVNHVESCYNRVKSCGKYLATAASGISFFEFWNVNGGDDANGPGGGYSNYLVGNIMWDNYNIQGGTDGNGLIIDDMNATQGAAYGGPTVAYTGKTLVMFNGGFFNGGRGVHSFQSGGVDMVFNTAAHNMRTFDKSGDDGNQADLSHSASSAGRAIANISCPRADRKPSIYSGQIKWFEDYDSGAVTKIANVCLRGADPTPSSFGTDTRVRNTEGENYFVAANDNMSNIAGWKPDGGNGAIERYTVSQADYNNWAYWPDYFGVTRPANRSWACGFAEP